MPLTDIQIRNFKPAPKPKKYYDGEGLHIQVMPKGSKLWCERSRKMRISVTQNENVPSPIFRAWHVLCYARLASLSALSFA